MDGIQEARLVQSEGYQTSNLRVVGSRPFVGKNLSFCILSLSTLSLQVDWSHANEIKHDVNRRYIGAKREFSFERKTVAVLVPSTR